MITFWDIFNHMHINLFYLCHKRMFTYKTMPKYGILYYVCITE